MARKRNRKDDAAREPSAPALEVEETEVSVPAEPEVEPSRPARCRVRCVDPTLRGYSVRGVVIPQGASVVVDLSTPDYALREAMADAAILVEAL